MDIQIKIMGVSPTSVWPHAYTMIIPLLLLAVPHSGTLVCIILLPLLTLVRHIRGLWLTSMCMRPTKADQDLAMKPGYQFPGYSSAECAGQQQPRHVVALYAVAIFTDPAPCTEGGFWETLPHLHLVVELNEFRSEHAPLIALKEGLVSLRN